MILLASLLVDDLCSDLEHTCGLTAHATPCQDSRAMRPDNYAAASAVLAQFTCAARTPSRDLYAELEAQQVGDCLRWTAHSDSEVAARLWYFHKKHPGRLHRYIHHDGTCYIVRCL